MSSPFGALRPGTFRHRLDCQHRRTLLIRKLEHRLAESYFEHLDEIDGEHDRIETKAVHGLERAFGRVGGKTDVADFALLFRFENGFHRAAGAERLFNFFRRANVVQLIQIEMVGLEPSQRAFQLFERTVLVTHFCLAGQEDFAAVNALQPDAHLYFAFAVPAVCGCDVIVINATLKGVTDSIVTAVLLVMTQGQSGKTHDRDFLAGAPEHTPRQSSNFFNFAL